MFPFSSMLQIETTTFKYEERYGQWTELEYKVLHKRTVNGPNYLQIANDVVSCTGSHSDSGSKFTLQCSIESKQRMFLP